jgi:hypothetical protein
MSRKISLFPKCLMYGGEGDFSLPARSRFGEGRSPIRKAKASPTHGGTEGKLQYLCWGVEGLTPLVKSGSF